MQVLRYAIFQSTLPRRERRGIHFKIFKRRQISIHTPTKGATIQRRNATVAGVVISIHTPTKGATKSLKRSVVQTIYFNPHSHEGSDTVRRSCLRLNILFQSTLPRRERFHLPGVYDCRH